MHPGASLSSATVTRPPAFLFDVVAISVPANAAGRWNASSRGWLVRANDSTVSAVSRAGRARTPYRSFRPAPPDRGQPRRRSVTLGRRRRRSRAGRSAPCSRRRASCHREEMDLVAAGSQPPRRDLLDLPATPAEDGRAPPPRRQPVDAANRLGESLQALELVDQERSPELRRIAIKVDARRPRPVKRARIVADDGDLPRRRANRGRARGAPPTT